MPNSAEARAREIRELIYRTLPVDKDGIVTLYDIWAKNERHIQQLKVPTQEFVDALTTYAAQQVADAIANVDHSFCDCEYCRTQMDEYGKLKQQMVEQVAATWEEITPYLHHLNGCGCHANCKGQQDHVCNCGLEEFRRRAQEGKG